MQPPSQPFVAFVACDHLIERRLFLLQREVSRGKDLSAKFSSWIPEPSPPRFALGVDAVGVRARAREPTAKVATKSREEGGGVRERAKRAIGA